MLRLEYGIAANTYPGEDIPNLTLARAKYLYRRDVWGRAGCEVFHQCLKFDLFDTAVHSGYKQTLKFLRAPSASRCTTSTACSARRP